MSVPRPASALGFAGLIPFVFGAAAAQGFTPALPVTGFLLLQAYGAAILAFMGGCLWGFSCKADRAGWVELSASVIPALWAVGATWAPNALLTLALGFAVLLGFDFVFHGRGVTPPWWMRLRIPLTVVAVACLVIGAM